MKIVFELKFHIFVGSKDAMNQNITAKVNEKSKYKSYFS